MLDIAYVNNPAIICKNPKVTAINSCIEVDITGQVVSDSIGHKFFSGKYFQTYIHPLLWVFNYVGCTLTDLPARAFTQWVALVKVKFRLTQVGHAISQSHLSN